MKRSIVLISLGIIGLFSQASAVIQPQSSFPTFEVFQASGDAPICKVVTDGCNEWQFIDGQKSDPIKLCKLTADFEYSWSCAQYDDSIMFLQGSDENGVTNDMMYMDPLTLQERKDYDALYTKLSSKEVEQVYTVTGRYMEVRAKYSLAQQDLYFQKVQNMIEKHIDLHLGEQRVYMMLQYLKLELKLLSQSFPIGGVIPLSGEVYTCATAEYRVYDEDYLIDDMMFSVAEDEIHVSDGAFLLPNFVASKEISASGTKYVGKNTEIQEVYSFWMKGNELSVYKADMLVDTCMKK